MILTLQEDGVLRIYDSVANAVLDVEALDAEVTFRGIFDETGQWYAIQWIRPNKFGKFTAENGEYVLVPAGADSDGLLRIIREARFVEPRELEPEMRNLERRLTGR